MVGSEKYKDINSHLDLEAKQLQRGRKGNKDTDYMVASYKETKLESLIFN